MTAGEALDHARKNGIQDDRDLLLVVNSLTGLTFPTQNVCPHHNTPFDYLRHAFFEPASDVVVWAPRGGGKTRLGALATLLDLLLKPNCQVRILGGSLHQSLLMWNHLWPDIQRLSEAGLIDASAKQTQITLPGVGSAAAVLTQSQKAVRGLRIQKLRCDEVELFDPEVWTAAQLVTKSQNEATGVIEAFSTLHRPFGLMQRILNDAAEKGIRIIRWCLLDVLEHCPPERDCDTCPLLEDCGRIAKKKCNGFFKIDDAIAMKRRVSAETWQSEILCLRPSLRGAVFPSFDPALHVREIVPACDPSNADVYLGIDFGYANPFVCLWILEASGITFVIDEYVQEQRMMDDHIQHIASRPWPRPARIHCDPAGNARNDQTGRSNVKLLQAAGYDVKSKSSQIVEGLEAVRAAIHPAHGQARLFIHPRCKHLIKALKCYRFPDNGSEVPLKDNEHDHLIDALRYHFINRHSKPLVGKPY